MWFLIGLILGALLLGLATWMRRKNISLTWYEWLIGIVGLVLLVFTIQNFFASFTELESSAAWMFLLVVGLPALILLTVTWQLAARRQRAG
jgi:uncharacterized membrane protein